MSKAAQVVSGRSMIWTQASDMGVHALNTLNLLIA